MKAIAKKLKIRINERKESCLDSNCNYPYCTESDCEEDKFLTKIFAVTQDIKNGDIVHINGEPWTVTDESKAIASKGLISIKAINLFDDWYKILGELSPATIGIKDGDEIEIASDMGFPVFYGNKKDPFGYWGAEHKPKEGEYLKTQCPTCKSYH